MVTASKRVVRRWGWSILFVACLFLSVAFFFDGILYSPQLPGAMQRARKVGIPLSSQDYSQTAAGSNTRKAEHPIRALSVEEIERLDAWYERSIASRGTQRLDVIVNLLKEVESLWPKLNEIADNPDIVFADSLASMTGPDASNHRMAKVVVAYLGLTARLHATAGKHRDASNEILQMGRLVDAMSQPPSYLAQVSGVTSLRDRTWTVARCLSFVQTPDDLQEYEKVLQQSFTRPQAIQGLRSEAYWTLVFTMNGERRVTFSGVEALALERPLTDTNRVLQGCLAYEINVWSEVLEELQRTELTVDLSERITRKLSDAGEGWKQTRRCFRGNAQSVQVFLQAIMSERIREEILGSLVEAKRASLKAKSAPSLGILPTDPYSDQPLRSLITDSRCTVWSVGPNRSDEGGAGDDVALSLAF